MFASKWSLLTLYPVTGSLFLESDPNLNTKRSYKEGSGPDVIKLLSLSTQLNMKFILLINVKMPTIVGILTFISRINGWL